MPFIFMKFINHWRAFPLKKKTGTCCETSAFAEQDIPRIQMQFFLKISSYGLHYAQVPSNAKPVLRLLYKVRDVLSHLFLNNT